MMITQSLRIRHSISLLCFGLLLAVSPARAASLFLLPVSPVASLGDTVSLNLHMDFTNDPTLGGALDIFYDPLVLDYQSFVFDPAFPTDPAFSSPGDAGTPVAAPGEVIGIGFGNFSLGLAGPYQVGTLTFSAVGSGFSTISMAENILPLGGFFSADGTRELNPSLTSATVQVVPLPPSLWLLGSALLGFGGFARRKKKSTPL